MTGYKTLRDAGRTAILGIILCCGLSGCGEGTPSSKSLEKNAGVKTPGSTAATTPAAAVTDCGGILPSKDTILSGKYIPLSRPLFLHVNRKALQRPEVAAFAAFYLNDGQPLVTTARYINLPENLLTESRATLAKAAPAAAAGEKLSGKIVIDGSSTVYLITVAMVKKFRELHPDVEITIGRSGTGGGFKKFVAGETDINDSSRAISASEIEKCKTNSVEYAELKVALDGITVAVHPDNNFCHCLSVEQLKSLWKPGSKVKKWSELDPAWPAEEIRLFGPDADSGTFDYFTEAIVGKAKSCRDDYSASADDNQLIRGVKGDKFSLGYFGYAYFAENRKAIKPVGIIPAAHPSH